MEDLAAKITNLSYEIFGIVLPGFIGLVFFLAFWWALGSVPQDLSNGALPELTYAFLRNSKYTLFDVLMMGSLVYFVGHLLFWLSRKAGKEVKGSVGRVLSCLRFKIPRPSESYFSSYQDMLVVVAAKFGLPDDANTWVRFYPLAKVMLAHRLNRSLVSTYQNKYTLHRSITAAASLLFWTTLASIVTLVAMRYLPDCIGGAVILFPRWVGLSFNMIGALGIIWGFSDSFYYNWKMFGNTVITESYGVFCGFTESKSREG